MYQAAERIYEAFLRKNIKCKLREKGGMSLVETAFSGRNFASVSLYFLSNTDGNDVALRVSGVVKFPPERLARLYEACNELNRKYRYAKFVIDPEKAAELAAVLEKAQKSKRARKTVMDKNQMSLFDFVA